MGISVIALDNDQNAKGLQYACKAFIIDIKYPHLIYKILDQFRIETVIPVPIGKYLTSTGAVNDHYNLHGVTFEAAVLCTDKHLFHNKLSQHEMRKAEHVLISSGEDKISKIIDSMHYPVIGKPRFGSGNKSVQVYQNHSDLKNNFVNKLPYVEDFVIESCIEGIEYGLDAAIINGKFHLILLREKILTPYPYRQCVGYYSVTRDEKNMELLTCVENTVNKAGQVLGLNNCLLHADIIYDRNIAFIIEMSARPSGHNLHNIFTPMATGVNMVSEYLKYSIPQLNQSHSFTPTFTNCLLIRYFDFSRKRVIQIPEKDFLYKKYPIKLFECNLSKGMILQQVTDGHSIMNRGYYIVEGTDNNELNIISEEINNQFILESI